MINMLRLSLCVQTFHYLFQLLTDHRVVRSVLLYIMNFHFKQSLQHNFVLLPSRLGFNINLTDRRHTAASVCV